LLEGAWNLRCKTMAPEFLSSTEILCLSRGYAWIAGKPD
jgi:hypothetical protein